MTYIPILHNPTENTEEANLCLNCQLDLTDEEIKEDLKNCFRCIDEIEQNNN
jgi:hypothetical protein